MKISATLLSLSFCIVAQHHAKALTKFNIFRSLTSTPPIKPPCFSQNQASDEVFMQLALRHAQHAYRDKEIPVGAVIVGPRGEVLAASRNRVEISKDATAHAEIECIRRASRIQGDWRLSDCTLYTTLQPCTMCIGAIKSARLKRLVFGARDPQQDSPPSVSTALEVTGGVLAEDCSLLLRRFFKNVRSFP
jgi:tRNA(adenine34) deaminase